MLNNPTTLTDPLGLFAGNPADQCNGGDYTDARCQGPPGCSWVGDPNCCAGPDIGDDNAELCYPMSGNFPPLNPWNPLPAITQPTAAGQLGALGGGGSCGPFGCYGGLNFQEEEGAGIYAILRALEAAGSVGLGYLLTHSAELQAYARWCLQTQACSNAVKAGRVIINAANSAGKAAADDAFACSDAPCIQKALENIRQQQINGTWQNGVSPTSANSPAAAVKPNPKSLVPAVP